jgi:hypothetical protein
LNEENVTVIEKKFRSADTVDNDKDGQVGK